MIPLILPQDSFPNPHYAIENQDGLVCVTESLLPALLLKAYPQGIFPWYNDEHFFIGSVLHRVRFCCLNN